MGARPGTAERAAHRLAAACPQQKIVGCASRPFRCRPNPRDRRSHSPLESRRLARCDGQSEAGDCSSTSIWLRRDASSGSASELCSTFLPVTSREPRLRVQRLRLEWLYRLAKEPRRLARRYLIGNPLFLMRIAQQWWSGARVRQAEPDSGFMEAFPAEIGPSKRTVAAHKAMSA